MLLVSWYKRAPGNQRQRVRNQALLWGGLGLVLVLLLTGRLNPVFAALAGLLAAAPRLIGLLQTVQAVQGLRNSFKSARGPTPGQTSQVETAFLRMELDHGTGEMSGLVLRGRHGGRSLSELSIAELLDLLEECRGAGDQSAAVLEAYLDRVHGDEWRERAGPQGSTPREGPMSAEQAREILGVGAAATVEEIVAAHRRLMQKLHPDRGGSTYLAAQVNRAKDVLLGERGSR